MLHKALGEELHVDIEEWCGDTIDWHQRRNDTILNKRSGADELEAAANEALAAARLQRAKKLANKVKKYKLLIPLDMDMSEKLRLEERQKRAIHKLIDIFPDFYDAWHRRKRLRRQLVEEAPAKSQFLALWALNSFALLIKHVHVEMTRAQHDTLHDTGFLDPRIFLYEENFVLLRAGAGAESNSGAGAEWNAATKRKKSDGRDMALNAAAIRQEDEQQHMQQQLQRDIATPDAKDTSDIFASVLSSLDDSNNNLAAGETPFHDSSRVEMSNAEFSERAANIFGKFKCAAVLEC